MLRRLICCSNGGDESDDDEDEDEDEGVCICSSSRRRNVRLFSLRCLKAATRNFTSLIGKGGYGSVYKAFLPCLDSINVAIKKLHTTSRYYDEEEFLQSVEILSHIQHRNVNRILGGCVEDGHRIIVAEYVHNGDLSAFLKRSSGWAERVNLCIGIARGLSYLQEDVNPRIIHGDIKSSNILVGQQGEPKIADFDLVEFRDPSDTSPRRRSVLTGSVGYVDPQYGRTQVYTEKSDVYSFGVLMLEIISGRDPLSFPEMFRGDTSGQGLLNWALSLKRRNMVSKIVDPSLRCPILGEVEHLVNVAFLCSQEESSLRPRMSQVVHMLCGGSQFGREAMGMLDTNYTMTLLGGVDEEIDIRTPCDESMNGGSSSSKGKGIASSTTLEPMTMPPLGRNMEKTTGTVTRVMRANVHEGFKKVSLKYSRGSTSNKPTRKAHTMVLTNYSENTSMEAVYPPMLTGVTRRSGFTF